MLVIRMQRTGRKGHAQFRVVVQDSRRTPTSGKIVASLGHFNPHTKQTALDKDKTKFYLDHGAQPSDRVARLLKAEGVKLPKWVTLDTNKKRPIRNIEKLRRNRPDEPVEAPAAPETTEAPAEEVATEAAAPTEEAQAKAAPEETETAEPEAASELPAEEEAAAASEEAAEETAAESTTEPAEASKTEDSATK